MTPPKLILRGWPQSTSDVARQSGCMPHAARVALEAEVAAGRIVKRSDLLNDEWMWREVRRGDLRYRVESFDRLSVTYRTWIGNGWSDTRTIVRSAWIALTSPGWVGPGHAAPGWAEADEDFNTRRKEQ